MILKQYDETGAISKKLMQPKLIYLLARRAKSMEEQNKHLSTYLQEMVKQNESL